MTSAQFWKYFFKRELINEISLLQQALTGLGVVTDDSGRNWPTLQLGGVNPSGTINNLRAAGRSLRAFLVGKSAEPYIGNNPFIDNSGATPPPNSSAPLPNFNNLNTLRNRAGLQRFFPRSYKNTKLHIYRALKHYFSYSDHGGWRHVNLIWLLDMLVGRYLGPRVSLPMAESALIDDIKALARSVATWEENPLMFIDPQHKQFDNEHIPNNNLMCSQANKANNQGAGFPNRYCQESFNQPLNPILGLAKPPINIGLTQKQLRVAASIDEPERIPWIYSQKSFLFNIWGTSNPSSPTTPNPAPTLNNSGQNNNSFDALTGRYNFNTARPLDKGTPLCWQEPEGVLEHHVRCRDFDPKLVLTDPGSPSSPIVTGTALGPPQIDNLTNLPNTYNTTILNNIQSQNPGGIKHALGAYNPILNHSDSLVKAVYDENVPLELFDDDGFLLRSWW